MPIKATWCLSDNVGDKLTPWLIKKVTGEYPIYIDPYINDNPRLLGIGSILNWNHQKDQKLIVWGSGIANNNDKIEKSDFRLVRGPICSKRIMDLYNIQVPFGDPGLLVSSFINNPVTKSYEIGIIPHYIDQSVLWNQIKDNKNIHFINILDSIETIIEEIRKCNFVYSSSLHGLVLCDSYNIPNSWIKLTNNIIGDDTKFLDYLMSVGRETKFLDFRSTGFIYPNNIGDQIGNYSKLEVINNVYTLKEIIWKTCPFSTKELK